MRSSVIGNVDMFGLHFFKGTYKDVVDEIRNNVKRKANASIFTVNVDHICLAASDEHFGDILRRGDIIVADGMPLVWYSKFIGNPLPIRLTGVDLTYKICLLSGTCDLRLFFLGASQGVAERAIDNIRKQYTGVQIEGYYSPTRKEITDSRLSLNIIEKIKQTQANVVFVAFGAPLQERWIDKYRDQFEGVTLIGVGATFDFMSGDVRRAPLWMQKRGLEWMFRIYLEPSRLMKRYLIRDFKFPILVLSDLRNRASN